MSDEALGETRAGAILLNPTGVIQGTSTSVRVLEDVRLSMGWAVLEIANLVGTPTRNSKELEDTTVSHRDFLSARDRLERVVATSDTLIFAWGIAPLRGMVGKYLRDQTEWIVSQARHHGHTHAWMMDGRPRHPSRWRQYVGPQRGLFKGDNTAARLAQGLQRCAVDEALPPQRRTSEVAGNLPARRGGRFI